MNRSLLTSAALAALIAAPALAQQTNPAPSDSMQNRQQPTQTLTTPAPSALPVQAEMTAEDLQGLTVYTTKVETAATGTTGSTGLTGTAGGTSSTMGSTATTGTAGPATVPLTTDNRLLTKAELKSLTDRSRSVGEVNDLLIGTDGRVQHAIIDVGGFLGVGERPVTVSWTDLKIVRTNEGDIVAFIDKSRTELNALPAYRAPNKN